MVFTVKLLPSERSFAVAPNQSLLEGALGAGISLDYGCANGSCGRCKAKLISGNVVDARFHDYVISAREKLEGYVLLCSSEARSNLVIEARTVGGVEDVELQTIKARFSRLVSGGSSIVILNVRTPRSQVLRFLAGQHVSLTFPSQQSIMLSLANCPCDGMNLEFHLPSDTLVSSSIGDLDTLKKGDVIWVHGPLGNFVLDEGAARPTLFIAVDSAFACIRSLIEQAMNLEWDQPIHLWRIIGGTGDPYLHNLCRSWADVWDDFHYRPLSMADNQNWVSTLERLLDELDLSQVDLYLAGRGEIIESVERLLQPQKAKANRIFVNEFERERI